MAKVAMLPVCLGLLLVVTLGQGSSVTRMSAGHSALLEKFQPMVKGFAETFTKAIGGQEEFQLKVADVIRRDIAAQMDKLVVMTNATATLEFCCTCATCTRRCTQCGRSCCCSGSGGCHCTSCSTDLIPFVTLPEMTQEVTSLREIWAAHTRQTLVKDLRTLVAAHRPDSNGMCCQCSNCYTDETACGRRCCRRGLACSCESCATQTHLFEADSIDNPIALTAEAEAAVQEVGSLVDNLLLMVSLL